MERRVAKLKNQIYNYLSNSILCHSFYKVASKVSGDNYLAAIIKKRDKFIISRA